MTIEWGKLAVLIVLTIGVIVLAALGRMDASTVTLFLGSIGGYVYGNGRLASKGDQTQPLVAAKGTRPTPAADAVVAASAAVAAAADVVATVAPTVTPEPVAAPVAPVSGPTQDTGGLWRGGG